MSIFYHDKCRYYLRKWNYYQSYHYYQFETFMDYTMEQDYIETNPIKLILIFKPKPEEEYNSRYTTSISISIIIINNISKIRIQLTSYLEY
jgi:hypothetical protein